MSKSKMTKAFILYCEETKVSGVVLFDEYGVGDFIGGDIGNNSGVKEFNYTVKVKYLNDRQLNSLPEYED